jgi:type VI secretion system protein ImpM
MDGLASSFPHVLHRVLQDLLLSYSLWWSPGSELVEPTLLISQGLPPSSGYAAMLDGDWSRWGWDARHVVPLARPG